MVSLTRGVPAPMLAAMAGTFYPVAFVYLDWPGATLRAHTGVGAITWGGQSWAGVGPMGSISIPAESGGSMVATEAALSLVADPMELDSYADDVIRNLAGEIYLGVVSARPGQPGGTTLVSDPVTIFSGLMDALVIEVEPTDTGVNHRATVTLITGPGARSDAAVYHSDQDQGRKYPGDTAGRHLVLAYAKAQKLTWPES